MSKKSPSRLGDWRDLPPVLDCCNLKGISLNLRYVGRLLLKPEAPPYSDYLSLSRYLSFSVLHNRHLSDILVIFQKCQFGVRKAWKALFLQLKPQEMHCKQADSATLKMYFLDSIQILQI